MFSCCLYITLFAILCPRLLSSRLYLRSRDKVRVYIENTDAFNVVYYANYPVWVERAVLKKEKIAFGRIKAFNVLKYKRPAVLGDEIDVIVKSSKGAGNVFNVALSGERSGGEIVEFASAKKVVLIENLERLTSSEFPEIESDFKTYKSHFELWLDELGINGTLTTKTIFNVFERGRTELLGGPSSLASLSLSSNHVYVARVSDYELLSDPVGINSIDLESEPSHATYPVCVSTQCCPVGVDDVSIVVFNQQISGLEAGVEILYAKAKITCVCVDSITGQPTPFSDDIKKLFV